MYAEDDQGALTVKWVKQKTEFINEKRLDELESKTAWSGHDRQFSTPIIMDLIEQVRGLKQELAEIKSREKRLDRTGVPQNIVKTGVPHKAHRGGAVLD